MSLVIDKVQEMKIAETKWLHIQQKGKFRKPLYILLPVDLIIMESSTMIERKASFNKRTKRKTKGG